MEQFFNLIFKRLIQENHEKHKRNYNAIVSSINPSCSCQWANWFKYPIKCKHIRN